MSKSIAYTEEFGYHDIRVRVECPLCRNKTNYWMVAERTQKLCHICGRVTFVFICSIPRKGLLSVEVHCEFNDTSEMEIDPERVIILRDEDVDER